MTLMRKKKHDKHERDRRILGRFTREKRIRSAKLRMRQQLRQR